MSELITEVIFWINMIPLGIFTIVTTWGLCNHFDNDHPGTDKIE